MALLWRWVGSDTNLISTYYIQYLNIFKEKAYVCLDDDMTSDLSLTHIMTLCPVTDLPVCRCHSDKQPHKSVGNGS